MLNCHQVWPALWWHFSLWLNDIYSARQQTVLLCTHNITKPPLPPLLRCFFSTSNPYYHILLCQPSSQSYIQHSTWITSFSTLCLILHSPTHRVTEIIGSQGQSCPLEILLIIINSLSFYIEIREIWGLKNMFSFSTVQDRLNIYTNNIQKKRLGEQQFKNK